VKLWAKVFTVWAAILVVAALNGALRETVLTPVLGAFGGRLASGVILCAGIFLAAWLAAPWYGPQGAARSWAIGACWLVATLAFEVGIGLAQGRDFRELFQAYTFEGGNIWPLILVAALVSPPLAARVRRAA
jgi:hypothetical protein